MARIDFELRKRFDASMRSAMLDGLKLRVEKVGTQLQLVLIIPLNSIDHSTEHSEFKYRMIDFPSDIPILSNNIYIEPIVKQVDDPTRPDNTSNLRLTAVIEFDSKKPKDEG